MFRLTAIATAAAVLASAPAWADDLVDCSVFGDFAENLMAARQEGAKMSDAMELTSDFPDLGVLVRVAYDRPRYASPEAQEDEILDFRNDVEAECYRVRSNL